MPSLLLPRQPQRLPALRAARSARMHCRHCMHCVYRTHTAGEYPQPGEEAKALLGPAPYKCVPIKVSTAGGGWPRPFGCSEVEAFMVAVRRGRMGALKLHVLRAEESQSRRHSTYCTCHEMLGGGKLCPSWAQALPCSDARRQPPSTGPSPSSSSHPRRAPRCSQTGPWPAATPRCCAAGGATARPRRCWQPPACTSCRPGMRPCHCTTCTSRGSARIGEPACPR